MLNLPMNFPPRRVVAKNRVIITTAIRLRYGSICGKTVAA